MEVMLSEQNKKNFVIKGECVEVEVMFSEKK